MRSDWFVVEHATRISDREAPVDFNFGAIRPPVPGAGAAAQFSQRCYPLAPQALPRPQAGFQFGRIKPAAMLRRVVHREPAPQLVTLFRTEGSGERFFLMRVEVIQYQMNGARFGVAQRDPFERSCKLPRGTVFRGVGLMATGLGLDHTEHVGSAVPRVLVVAACGSAGRHRAIGSHRVQQLHRPLVQRHYRRVFIPRLVQHLQHLLHPLQVLLVQLRPAPHFFSATASARGFPTDGGWSPAPPCGSPRAAVLARPSARWSSVRARAAGGRTPSPRSQPAAWHPKAWAAWGAGRHLMPRPNPAPGTAARPAAPRADRCPSPLRSGSVSTPDPIVPGSVSAASAVHLTAACRPALLATPGGRSPSAATLGTSFASASSAPRILFDQIQRPSASHLLIPMLGSKH